MQVVQKDLTFCGLFGVSDTVRMGVSWAVETYAKAGINVLMVTGDNIITAKAVALEAGIIT